MITAEKAELVGFLCAEGCYYKYISKGWEFDKRRNNSYFRIKHNEVLQMGNNNLKIQRRFLFLLNKIYGYEIKFYGKPNSMRCTIKRKDVIKDLMQYSKTYNSFGWRLHKSIISGSKHVKLGFLRGFFDGDGSISLTTKNRYKIRFFSVNLKELKKVQKITNSLGMRSKIYGPYWGKSSKTGIYELTLISKDAIDFVSAVNPTKIKPDDGDKNKMVFGRKTLVFNTLHKYPLK